MTKPKMCTCGVELKTVTIRVLQHKNDTFRVHQLCRWPRKGKHPGTVEVVHDYDHVPSDVRRRPDFVVKATVTFV